MLLEVLNAPAGQTFYPPVQKIVKISENAEQIWHEPNLRLSCLQIDGIFV